MTELITGSKELIRDINSKLVLETVIREKNISRASIAKELGLTKATVSAIVSDLIERGLVAETGSGDTASGRKPIMLRFVAEAGYVISVDLGVSVINVARTDLLGENVSITTAETPESPEDTLDVLEKLIDSQIDRAADSRYGLVGIAIGIHGAVKDNKVLFTPYYKMDELDLQEMLTSRYKTNVYLENEANLSALGEGTFIHNCDMLVNISVHSGIGMGILFDQNIREGAEGNAGEIGHTIVEVDGRPCPCGNKGCLEQYVSERVLFAEFARKKGRKAVDPDEFFEMYAAKDKDAVETVDRFVKYMAVGVGNVINTLDPDIVVINSSFVANVPRLTGKIQKKLTCRIAKNKKIEASSLQDASTLLGGVYLVVKKFTGINRFA